MSETYSWQGSQGQESFVGRALRNGQYRVEGILRHGGVGRRFLALHVALDIPVTLKQLRADEPLPDRAAEELNYVLRNRTATGTMGVLFEYDFPPSGGTHTDRFLREALLLVRLHHPAIPTLYDYFLEDGYWYLVLDYIAGPTLATYIRQHAPLPPLEALNYAMQFCDTLDYLHEQSPPVIFRDLTPANAILAPNGRLVLIDFGIARYLKDGGVNDTIDPGMPGYTSPEQYQASGQVDGRSDLFSLGVILHEMISGEHPLDKVQKLESVCQMNPALSPVLSALITVATRAEPLYRFQSAHAFFEALERTYVIEERRAYQQRMLIAQETGHTNAGSPLVIRLKEMAQEEKREPQATNGQATGEQERIRFASDLTVALQKAASPLPVEEQNHSVSSHEAHRPQAMQIYLVLAVALLLILVSFVLLLKIGP